MTEAKRPRARGCRVIQKARKIEPSSIKPQRAAMVSTKVGKAGLIGTRPAYSQAAMTTITEITLVASGWLSHKASAIPGRRDAGSASAAAVAFALAGRGMALFSNLAQRLAGCRHAL